MKTGACSDGTLKTQPNKMGTTPQHFHTIPTSCAILPTMPCVSCVHRRVVEGSGLSSAGCTERKSEVRSRKIDDSPDLATCRSGTLAMLPSKVNSPVAHGSTR